MDIVVYTNPETLLHKREPGRFCWWSMSFPYAPLAPLYPGVRRSAPYTQGSVGTNLLDSPRG